MKAITKSRGVALLVLTSVLAMAGLSSCSAGAAGDPNAVAVKINGTEIKESTITDYIQNFRFTQQVTDDEAWGLWLTQYSMTPSTVRSDVIDYYVGQELVKQAAEEKNVTVADEDVQAEVDQMKANYGDDEAWQQALTDAGTTEAEYTDNVRTAMLEEALREKIIEENSAEVSDEDLLEQAAMYAPYFDGARKSSHILFNADDEATAQDVLNRINSGELDFAEAAKQYSQDTGSAEDGGNVGWDMLNSFVTAYTDALEQLDQGQTSGLVNSDFGIHIIQCTEKFTAPEEVTSLDQLPVELVDYIRDMATSSSENEAYNTWYEEYKEAADIEIADMPAGLPYDIDESLYTAPTTSSESTDNATAEDLGMDSDLTSSEMEEIAEAQAEAAAMDAEEAATSAVEEDEQTGSEKVAA